MPLRQAIIGPFDKPEAVIIVDVIDQADAPGFFVCRDESGKEVLVHRSKLRDIKLKLNGETK
jgi:Ni,Fe-hydrogenase maturation factor